MTATSENVQTDWIASLKSKPTVTTLLINGGANEVRECEWQGDKFQYPNIRVGIDFMPSIEGCGPDDADVYIEVFSAEKSSKECAHIASTIVPLYHKIPFEINGRRYSTVVVRKVPKPERSIYAWVTKIHIFAQVV